MADPKKTPDGTTDTFRESCGLNDPIKEPVNTSVML
jgi:hypothetical protein